MLINKMVNKKGVLIVVILMVSILSVNAGFFNKITGKALEKDVDVSVTIGNDSPIIEEINPPTVLDLSEDGSANIPFNFIVYDPNGVSDLDDSSVVGNYHCSDNTPNNYDTIRTGVCRVESGDEKLDGTSWGYEGEFVRRYSCDVDMYYYDDARVNDLGIGNWVIEIEMKDSVGNLVVDNSVKFAPNEMNGLKVDSNLVSWTALSPGSQGVIAENPIKIYNTGNAYFDGSSDAYRLKITGSNLYGITDNSQYISASNFKVNNENFLDCSIEGSALLHDALIIMPDVDLKNGDNTQEGHAESEVYFCLTQLDLGLSSQEYSTTIIGVGETVKYPWKIGM